MTIAYTENYNLGKQEDIIDKFNMPIITGNMDTIDTVLFAKVDKVDGKQLSTNDYTDAEKALVATIASLEARITALEGGTA